MFNKFVLFSSNVLIRPANFSLGANVANSTNVSMEMTCSYSNHVFFGVVLSVASDVSALLKPGDCVFYDPAQSYSIEVDKQIYHIVDFKKILGVFLS